MDIFEVIKTRRSIRFYQDKRIQKETIEKIIDAARFAPTARDVQPWEFIIITEKDLLFRLADFAEHGKFIKDAAACIAVYVKDTKYYLEDGSAAATNILLAARALEVASCWVAGDKKEYCKDISSLLDVPAEFKLIALISLGYPKHDDEFKIAHKRTLEEVIHWESFKEKT